MKSQQQLTITPEEARTISKEAYIYGFPLVDTLSAYSLIGLSQFIRFQLEIWSTRTVEVSAFVSLERSNETLRPRIPTFVDPGRS